MNSRKLLVSIVLVLITTLCMMVLPTYAAEYGITFTVNPATTTAKLGDTISVDLGIADIDQSTNGINAVQGDVVYDESLFESVDLIGVGNNWSVSYNNTNSELKGRFVLSNMNSSKETQVVARVVAKIKANATVEKGTITLKDMFSSYGSSATDKTTKTITVNIGQSGSQEDGNVIDNTSKDDKSSNTSKNTSGGTSSSTKNNTSSTNPSKTNTSTSSKASSLPKAGISSWIAIFVIAAIVVAIIEFIKYRKITK